MRWLAVLVALSLAACSGDTPSPVANDYDNAVPVIYTVNYPLAWMARALGGEAVQVVFPAPADVDPAFWQPDTDTVLAYQRADLVLLNGADYARWTASVSLPVNRLVDTSAAFAGQLLPAASGPVHSHGPGGEHSHGELAFTTWLDLQLARKQTAAVADALVGLVPAAEQTVRQRQVQLDAQLAALDARLLAVGQALAQAPLVYSHPVYQYLQRRYRLNGKALHWEPDLVPAEAQWQALAALLREHPARLMLWEGQPLPEVAERLAQSGIEVLVFPPMGNRPSLGDFPGGLEQSITRLENFAASRAGENSGKALPADQGRG